jgi:hypothetical protein
VCRKRDAGAATVTRADFVRALKLELPEAIDNIRKAGVGPVDMQQSVIGPDMGVFSCYAKVLEDDDSAMPVRTALTGSQPMSYLPKVRDRVVLEGRIRDAVGNLNTPFGYANASMGRLGNTRT